MKQVIRQEKINNGGKSEIKQRVTWDESNKKLSVALEINMQLGDIRF